MGGLGKPQPDPNPRRPENTTLPPAVYAARQIEDLNERRNAVTAASRDMRYFAERLRTAQRMPDPVERDTVAFGFRVTFARDDGRRQTFRIVGEDEANRRAGSIS